MNQTALGRARLTDRAICGLRVAIDAVLLLQPDGRARLRLVTVGAGLAPLVQVLGVRELAECGGKGPGANPRMTCDAIGHRLLVMARLAPAFVVMNHLV